MISLIFQMSDSEEVIIADFVEKMPNIRKIFQLCASSDSEDSDDTEVTVDRNTPKMKKQRNLEHLLNYLLEEDDNQPDHHENEDHYENEDHIENADNSENQNDDIERLVNQRPKRKYKFRKNRDIEDPAEYSDEDFREVFRMSRPTFDLLLDIVANKFPRLGLSPNKKSLTPRKRLLMFLLVAGSDTAGIYRKHNFQLSHGCITDNMTMCINVLYDGKDDDYEQFYFMLI